MIEGVANRRHRHLLFDHLVGGRAQFRRHGDGSAALSANRASLAEVHVCVAPMSHHMKTEFANKSLRPPIETDYPS